MNDIKKDVRCVWLTGLSGSGKTTLANELKKELDAANIPSVLLDGDIIRKGMNKDIGFSEEARKENIRRVAEIAKIILQSEVMVICAFMSPTKDIRAVAQQILGDYYCEIFVDTSIEVCIARDVKGLYKRALSGEMKNVSGIDSPFEPPVSPELIITTENSSPKQGAALILKLLNGKT